MSVLDGFIQLVIKDKKRIAFLETFEPLCHSKKKVGEASASKIRVCHIAKRLKM